MCGGKPDANGDGVIEPGPGLCHDWSGAPLICPINGEPVLFGVASQGINSYDVGLDSCV